MDDARTTWNARADRFAAAAMAHPKVWLIAAALLCAIRISPWWFATPDSVGYMSIARSLWEPGGPTNLGRPQLYFSIGYPLLIAPTFLISDRPFLWITTINWLLTLALIAGVYRWAKPFGATAALVATVATVVHPLYGNSMRRPLSETFFMTTMVWTVIVLDLLRTADTRRKRVLAGIGGTLLLTAACLIRPNGIPIIAGFGMAMLCGAWGDRRRVLSAIVTAGVIGGIAGGIFFAARKIDDSRATDRDALTYWDQIGAPEDGPSSSMFDHMMSGLTIQMYDFERVIVPGTFKSRSTSPGEWNVNLPLGLAAAFLVGLGWWQAVRTRGDVWTWTFPFYLGVNVLWGADAGTRYTLPVMPVVFVAFWLGLNRFWTVGARWALLFIVLHAGVGLGFWLGVDLPRAREHNRHWESVDRLAAMVDRDRDSFAGWKLSPEQTSFFRFVLDRQFYLYSLEEVPTAMGLRVATTVPVDRLFTLSNVAPPPGYEKVADDGPYALLRRVK